MSRSVRLGLLGFGVLCCAAASVSAAETEVVFCIDGSGSISFSDFNLQKAGVFACIEDEAIVPRDGSVSVAIVLFADNANTILPLTPVTDSSVTGIGILLFFTPRPGGSTNMTQALSTARGILNAGSQGAEKFIILSTDGVPNDEPSTSAQCGAAADEGTVICTIGVGNDINEALLQNCANETGGGYGFASSFSGFQQVCRECVFLVLINCECLSERVILEPNQNAADLDCNQIVVCRDREQNIVPVICDPPGPYPAGVNAIGVRLAADGSDDSQVFDVCTLVVTRGDEPNCVICPAPLILECSDPDLRGAIRDWLNSAMLGDDCDGWIGNSFDPNRFVGDDCLRTQTVYFFLGDNVAPDDNAPVVPVACSSTITIRDTTPPMAFGPTVTGADVDANCVAMVSFSIGAKDNCQIPSVDFSISVTNASWDPNSVRLISGVDPNGQVAFGGTFKVYGVTDCPAVVTVDFIVTDGCGHATNTSASANVYDRIDPNITIPPDVTIFCHDSTDPNENPALGKATATDNCDPNVEISYTDDCHISNCRGKIYRTWTATDNCDNAVSGVQTINVVGRGSTGQKGSLLILPKVEQRYDDAGNLAQDTFITLSNDSTTTQFVKLFYVDGDTWESVDNGFVLTPEEPYYFSLENPLPNASGQTPRRFRDVLGGASPQPDPLGRGGLTVRGFVLIFACDNTFNRPVRNNNLAAKATIVNYADTEAYEYDATAFLASCVPHGAIIDRDELMLGGDYDYAPGQLLVDLYTDNSEALGGSTLTELTLLVLDMDFRQSRGGPATTFAFFTVHKQDETPLTWQQNHCVTCWESDFISMIEPTAFNSSIVNADRVKARIETFRNDNICGVETRQAPLLGVMTKTISFATGARAYAASEPVGQLVEEARILIGRAQSLPGGELRPDEGTQNHRADKLTGRLRP
ncbi:MAG: VWA domain-containing protein [Phycisphaerales bacterium]|nr:VWA domain-containing protein [Phycisphaerales bacterium]